MLKCFEAELNIRKDGGVWKEGDLRARAFRPLGHGGHSCDLPQLLGDFAARESDVIGLLSFEHFNDGPFRERVDALHANTVESARNFVRVVAELSARVYFSQDHFNSRATIDGRIFVAHQVHRHAAAVVDHSATSVYANANRHRGREACHHFINRVVDALVHEMVKRVEPCSADVHAWAFANCFKPFEHLNGLGGVLRERCGGGQFGSGSMEIGHKKFAREIDLEQRSLSGGISYQNPLIYC